MMRIVDWTQWKTKIITATRAVNIWMSGIHPAAVKCPVSASLVGRSSHVKLSVRSIVRSILRCRSLKKLYYYISLSINTKMLCLLTDFYNNILIQHNGMDHINSEKIKPHQYTMLDKYKRSCKNKQMDIIFYVLIINKKTPSITTL
jgi:hypothetical protein